MMIRGLTGLAAGAALVGMGAAVAQAQPKTGPDGLPAGPGHDTFVRVCSACHAPDLVIDKRMDRDGWGNLVRTMIGHGATASEAEAREIIDYLAKAYSAPSEQAPTGR